MNIPYIKKLLRKREKDGFKIKNILQYKIEHIHNVSMDEVWDNLCNPINLIKVKAYPARSKHDESYRIYFEINKRKKLVVGITYKKLKNRISIITAFHTTRKTDKLIRKAKLR